ncbi:MAG TPA: hypothetical protein VGV61_11900 [Thermoanaerobaculia bacterium]|jgi:hypothetical protein|nr:hypothetical protein [Thermoanaerobaculia bacterium]
MSRCNRFAEEALLRIEQGLPLDDHFATCPDCLEARAVYERLRAGIASLEGDLAPSPRWQAEVWRRIEARRARRRGWLPWVLATGLAAALAVLLLLRTPAGDLGSVSLRADVQRGAAVLRGDEARPGDLLRLVASTGGAAHAELRVYRNDRELVLRCADRQPCVRSGRSLRAIVALDAVGSYQPLLLVGEQPFPPPTADLDRDAAAALARGARVELGPAVVVR